jgi:hypothetical protein
MKHIIFPFAIVLLACKYCKGTDIKFQIPNSRLYIPRYKFQIPKGDIVADRKEKLESKNPEYSP